MEHAALVVVGVGLLTLVLAFFIATWTVSRSFRPLARVEKTAAAIAAGDLSRRVEIENPNTEVGRLGSSLNAMLAHIETAFAARMASEERMRRFAADASHELRTPLVTIRGFSELYRHGALSTPEDVATAMGRIESEAKRMGAMVEDLLLLARIDEQRPLQQKPADLLLMANDAVVDTQATDRNRTITLTGLDGAPPPRAPVLGDEAKLRQVVSNLVGNALRYTPEGTPIELGVGVRTGPDGARQSVIEVRDHGPGVPDEEAARIFERFYRADTSRTRETGGSGLGLAIVAAIVGAHSGSVRLGQTDGGGATLVVSVPFLEEVNCPHRTRRRCPARCPLRSRCPEDPDEAVAPRLFPRRRLTRRLHNAEPCSAGPWPPPPRNVREGISMSIISVDTELLQLKSANVQATVERISADVHAMKRGLDELQGTGAAPRRRTSKTWSPNGR